MRPGGASVLLVADDVAKQVPRNVAVLPNKYLVAVDRDKLSKLEIQRHKGTVTAARTKDKDKDAWALAAPQALPADQVEVGAVLTKLRDLRAQGFLSDDASGIPRYLGKPEVRVALTDQAGATTTLLLASSPEKRGGTPSAYAAVAGKGPVTLVDAKALTDLGRTANDLRDRRLLGALEPRDVKRVRVQAGGQSMGLERTGDTAGRTPEPPKGGAHTPNVEDLLYTLPP